MNHVQALTRFILERHRIYLRKQSQPAAPWTKDPILQRYRFCNVYRELDTVTQWIAQHWRTPNQLDPDLWFAMSVARHLNWPETLQELGYPVPWDRTRFKKVLHARQARGEQLYNGAYMISTHGAKMNKGDYLAGHVLDPMWKNRLFIRPKRTEPLYTLHLKLIEQPDVASFMSGQIIADLKYAKPYLGARDWWTFAVSGPGSRRGLNRVAGFQINNPWKEVDWYKKLIDLKAAVDPLIKKNKMEPLHAQDLQNCLCEFDKYERVRLGEGRPKSTYPGV